jgi:hypothetical protein
MTQSIEQLRVLVHIYSSIYCKLSTRPKPMYQLSTLIREQLEALAFVSNPLVRPTWRTKACARA